MRRARVSLAVGLLATAVSLAIGVTYGAVSGYFGGKVDTIMMRSVDVLYSLPFMFFVIMLMVVFGRNIYLIFVALGAVEWLTMARIVRGQTCRSGGANSSRRRYATGVSNVKIIFRHVIPNVLGPVDRLHDPDGPKVILTESFLILPRPRRAGTADQLGRADFRRRHKVIGWRPGCWSIRRYSWRSPCFV